MDPESEEHEYWSPRSSNVTNDSVHRAMSPSRCPPTQVMERPSEVEFDSNRISSSVLAEKSSAAPTDWSVASNESLFSIPFNKRVVPRDCSHAHSEDASKSGELERSGDLMRLRKPASFTGREADTNRLDLKSDSLSDPEQVVQWVNAVDVIGEGKLSASRDDSWGFPTLSQHHQSERNNARKKSGWSSCLCCSCRCKFCHSCSWPFCCSSKWSGCCSCKWPSCSSCKRTGCGSCKWNCCGGSCTRLSCLPSGCNSCKRPNCCSCKWPSCGSCKWSSCCSSWKSSCCGSCKWPSSCCACKWPNCCSCKWLSCSRCSCKWPSCTLKWTCCSTCSCRWPSCSCGWLSLSWCRFNWPCCKCSCLNGRWSFFCCWNSRSKRHSYGSDMLGVSAHPKEDLTIPQSQPSIKKRPSWYSRFFSST